MGTLEELGVAGDPNDTLPEAEAPLAKPVGDLEEFEVLGVLRGVSKDVLEEVGVLVDVPEGVPERVELLEGVPEGDTEEVEVTE